MELFDKLNIFHESESGAQTVVPARDHSFSRPGARILELFVKAQFIELVLFLYIIRIKSPCQMELSQLPLDGTRMDPVPTHISAHLSRLHNALRNGSGGEVHCNPRHYPAGH